MTATLARLLEEPDLDLSVLAGEAGLDAPVRWVAVSELENPTPYLQGGELLLTTGMSIPRPRAGVDAYVERLMRVGVVGLGFGVKVVRSRVPAALVASARAHGLPLLEVGKPTPFIAISKAVADLLGAEQHRELTAGLLAQQEITRAAVLRGPAGVVTRLATAIDGEVAQLDAHGGLVHQAPPHAARDATEWEADVERLRGRGAAAVVSSDGQRSRLVQTLGTGGRVTGYLVTSRPDDGRSDRHRSTVNVAAALLSFASAQDGRGEAGRAARTALVELAVEHPVAVAGRLAALGGPVLAADLVRVVSVSGGVAAVERIHRRLEDEGPAYCLPWTTGHGVAVAVPSAEQVARVLDLLPAGACAGVSEPHPPVAIRRAVEEADRARMSAELAGVPVRHFGRLAETRVLGLADPEARAVLADTVLGPLVDYEQGTGVPMLDSMRAWLAHHGQFEPAAVSIGVHRHTMRYRIRKAAQLLDRDLDDPSVRMELWFALAVRSGQA